MTNADITMREYMEQEATQELRNRDRQGSFLVAMGGVSPAKGDLVVVDRDQAVVGDGDAVSVAAEILQNMFGTSEGWLAVDHPSMTKQWPEECGKGLGGSQGLQFSMECQLVAGEGTLEASHELAAKDRAEYVDR